jgi:DUF1680 family protein
MYSWIYDVAALTGDASYLNAIDKIWDNVVTKKLYITGGSRNGLGRSPGRDYELPNMTGTTNCAAIGNDYWNHRLFLLHADAKYIDVMERTLYNGLISGVSLDGKSFFYPNPLESNGQHQRSPWFGVACCPGNITRFIASVPGYVYAQKGDALYINLYVGSTAEIKMDNGRTVKLTQDTRYPWDGAVKMTVNPDRNSNLTVNVRIPGWAHNEAVPSDLYRFLDKVDQPVALKVNGKQLPIKVDRGYVSLNRNWKRGDVIELTLPMPIRRVVANDAVTADRGRVALQRGPIVYCAEWPDNPGGFVRNLMLADNAKLTAEFKSDLLKGVTVIKSKLQPLPMTRRNVVKTEQGFTAIPYYLGEPRAWPDDRLIPNSEASVKPRPFPTIATTSKVTVAVQRPRLNPSRINDGEEPGSSSDPSSYFDWWPAKGRTEWVQYAFEKTATVSQAEVYWFDDTGRGEVRVPASWRILYKVGEEWRPVENNDPFGVEKDRYNRVAFKPVTTTALRLEVTMQPSWSAGIQEWKVR